MKIKTILLDLDGVLVKCVQGIAKLMNVPFEEVVERMTPGEYHLGKSFGPAMGAKPDQFQEVKNEIWKNINAAGVDWWANLEPYNHVKALMRICKDIAPTYICSSPGRSEDAAAGKMIWIKKHLGKQFGNVILTPHKHLLAKPGVVLIDDSDKKCHAFVDAGGSALLFPQPWNRMYRMASVNTCGTIEDLASMLGRISDGIDE